MHFKFLASLLSIHYLHHENILINERPFCLTQQIITSPSSRNTSEMCVGWRGGGGCGGNKLMYDRYMMDRYSHIDIHQLLLVSRSSTGIEFVLLLKMQLGFMLFLGS